MMICICFVLSYPAFKRPELSSNRNFLRGVMIYQIMSNQLKNQENWLEIGAATLSGGVAPVDQRLLGTIFCPLAAAAIRAMY